MNHDLNNHTFHTTFIHLAHKFIPSLVHHFAIHFAIAHHQAINVIILTIDSAITQGQLSQLKFISQSLYTASDCFSDIHIMFGVQFLDLSNTATISSSSCHSFDIVAHNFTHVHHVL
jgi:hypothetical protein